MPHRATLIVHELGEPQTRLPDDLVAVATTLRARGFEIAFAHAGPRSHATFANAPAANDGRDGERRALRASLAQSFALADARESDAGALVVCDHGATLDALARDADFARLVRALDERRAPIVAIGRAPIALAHVRATDGTAFLAGRRVTYARDPSDCESGTEGDAAAAAVAVMAACGADVRYETPGADHVVVDAYLITAQNVRSAASAARTIAAYLAPPRKATLRAS